jgi:uncharacterized membrane protein
MALRDVDPERAWLGTLAALVAVVAAGSLLFPDEFYGGFVWHYFWGPVYADANGAACAIWDGGARTLVPLSEAGQCATAAEPVAYPGYTLVSEVGYMLLLLFGLGGVVLLLNRIEFLEERADLWPLVPFVFFGGALRVVEDANDQALESVAFDAFLTYPWNTLLISPVIYVTVFLVTLGAVVATVYGARRGHLDGYRRPLAAVGTALLAATLALLVWAAATKPYASFHLSMTALTLSVGTVAAAGAWTLAVRWWPTVASGTGRIGPLVVWAHAVDGTANVIGITWGEALGLPYGNMSPKHPANQAVIDITSQILPASVTDVTGTVWPFLPLKLAVAVGAVWLFNEETVEASPRYSYLMLLAIVAVGLGPGSRDMLRATFGV